MLKEVHRAGSHLLITIYKKDNKIIPNSIKKVIVLSEKEKNVTVYQNEGVWKINTNNFVIKDITTFNNNKTRYVLISKTDMSKIGFVKDGTKLFIVPITKEMVL